MKGRRCVSEFDSRWRMSGKKGKGGDSEVQTTHICVDHWKDARLSSTCSLQTICTCRIRMRHSSVLIILTSRQMECFSSDNAPSD